MLHGKRRRAMGSGALARARERFAQKASAIGELRGARGCPCARVNVNGELAGARAFAAAISCVRVNVNGDLSRMPVRAGQRQRRARGCPLRRARGAARLPFATTNRKPQSTSEVLVREISRCTQMY